MSSLRGVAAVGMGVLILTACGGSESVLSSPNAPATEKSAEKPAYQLLYSFNGTDGSAPVGTGLVALNGELYGTTGTGGDGSGCNGSNSGCGTAFEFDPSTGVERPIYSFQGNSDGAIPRGSLIVVNGTMYGVTYHGGGTATGCGDYHGLGCGTLYTITTSGAENVLHVFNAAGDGHNPYAAVVNVNGTLYGTTPLGGTASSGSGTVYSYNVATRNEAVVHSFSGGTDGASPDDDLTYAGGRLYGVTEYGGAGSGALCVSTGCGTVFAIKTSTGQESVLHVFTGGSDGAFPDSGGLVYDNGVLYGTTGGALTKRCRLPCGNVFALNISTGNVTALHTFKGGTDGMGPFGDLLLFKRYLYGTTTAGGGSGCSTKYAKGCGTIFRVSTSGSGYTVLHRFKGGTVDGWFPQTNLMAFHGAIYGTTYYGGPNAYGTIFAITP